MPLPNPVRRAVLARRPMAVSGTPGPLLYDRRALLDYLIRMGIIPAGPVQWNEASQDILASMEQQSPQEGVF